MRFPFIKRENNISFVLNTLGILFVSVKLLYILYTTLWTFLTSIT